MKYNYKTQRANLFTESGVKLLLEIKKKADNCLRFSDAVMMTKLIATGNSWDMLAAADYLVETGELREVTGENVAGQYRVFARPYT